MIIGINEKLNGLVYQLRIPMPMDPGYVFSYVIRVDNECIMIDAGYPSNDLLEPLVNRLREIPNCRLGMLFITHMHVDHIGLANELHNNLGLSVAMHRRDYEQVMKMNNRDFFMRDYEELLVYYGVPDTDMELLRSVINGISRRRRFSTVNPDVIINGDEERIDNIHVILTPGHSPGHISIILNEHNVAFTGDLVLPTITTHVGLTPINPGNPLLDYFKSLAKIRSMRPNCLYPGHEGDICNVNGRINELMDHRFSRLCEVLNILRNGALTIFEVARALRWMDNRDYLGLDPMNRYMALTETAALVKYLDYLGIIKAGNDNKYEIVKDVICNPQALIPSDLISP
ncbi:MBL fold metallo-hydrolase [Vulcanisaeta souniana]|uniref:Metallo-beta-lactamase domain-containing protein n=1 Tax=Vulcanisaeta souniana JCM 11219 TaxID=1293586 RepID=A0ABM8BNS3_9CREN|nr:MBL fold metallo-hydrolase [Vulcanisaeta souniana]BDR92664.1 hypothetical protein Vsou_17570 [Vulcanisaeta souniana JCM 11219]